MKREYPRINTKMGSCVSSVHKGAMGIRVSMCGETNTNTNTNKVVVPSPLHPKPINDRHPVSVFKDQSSRTHFHARGSREETFFDTQAWLESDCDDDFLSVNGDFTPSRGNTPSCGNTPNRQSSFLGTPQRTKSLFMVSSPNSKPKPSPTDKKKKLFELFKDKLEVAEDTEDQTRANRKLEVKTSKSDFQSKSTPDTSYISGANSVCSSERTPSRDLKPAKQKLSRTVPCCLPNLVPSRKSTDKKMPSPEKNAGA